VPMLFDASAITNLIISGGRRALKKTAGHFTLDLTGYEIGNAVWRLCSLERKLNHAEASELVESAVDLLGQLHQVRLEELDARRILDIGISNRISFYDASYVVAADAKRFTIVTDDGQLAKIAKEYVQTKRSTEI